MMHNAICGIVSEHGADCALFLDVINRRYVTGFHSSEGAVIVSGSETVLLLDARYYESALQASLKSGVRVVLASGIINSVKEELMRIGAKKVLIDSAKVFVNTLDILKKTVGDGVEFAAVAEPLAKLRKKKTADEIKAIKAAQAITDAAYDNLMKTLRFDMTEREVAFVIDTFIRKNGAVPAFDTIAVSGPRSAFPHGTPTDNKLTMDSFLTMDFGACLNGYCSDMTRTVVIGKADDEMKRMYEAVVKAREAAFAVAKPGVRCCDVDKAARDVIESYGYGKYFNHATGHSIGLEVHEAPAISPKCEEVLEENYVFTVEPGIYVAGYCGLRIEDILFLF